MGWSTVVLLALEALPGIIDLIETAMPGKRGRDKRDVAVAALRKKEGDVPEDEALTRAREAAVDAQVLYANLLARAESLKK